MATISAAQFIALLERAQSDSHGVDAGTVLGNGEDLSGLRIPTGPKDIVHLDNPNDGVLEVTDSVDLRGRKLTHPIFVYGVRFRGRVDLREMTIQGGVDLTACIFDEELYLDDTEIEGSLRLAQIGVMELSMNGVIVHGRLNLRACQATKISMFDASVDGFVDLRSVSCEVVRLKGAHIRSDLRIGCGPDSVGNACRLHSVDASGSRIDGRVSVDGCGYGQSRPTSRIGSMPATDPAGDMFRWPEEDKSLVGLRLDLSLAKVGGSVQVMAFYGQITHFDNARERGCPKIQAQTPIVWPILERLDLTGAVIEGDVALLGTLVTDGIDARGARIGGQFCLLPGIFTVEKKGACLCRQTEIRQGQHASMGAIDLRVARIDGEIIIEGVQLRGNLDLSSSTIGSYMRVSGFRFWDKSRLPIDIVVPTTIYGDVLLYLATLGNALEFLGAHITENLVLWSVVSSAYICLRPFANLPSRVDGHIDLHSARLLQFELIGATVKGRVRLDGCEMLYFYAPPGWLKMPADRKMGDPKSEGPAADWLTDDAIVLSEVGHLVMRNGNIAGDMALEYLQVTGREVDGRSGLVIEDSKIGGSLLFFGEPAILKAYLKKERYAERRVLCPVNFCNFSATVVGGIQLKRSVVGAAVDMSAIKVDGAIDFEDSSVGGDLRFAAVRRSGDSSEKQKAELAAEHLYKIMNPAVCDSLILRMVKCTNDVDLTGLVVVRNEFRECNTGYIDARYASVSGDLKCYNFDKSELDPPAFVRVERYFDVSYSQLAHLVVSGDMFTNLPKGDTKKGLLLERAKVGKFEVREAHEFDCDEGGSTLRKGSELYPNPLCLADAKIEAWEVHGREDRDNDPKCMYINLLANDEPFRRSTYRSLENSLRSGGDDHYADALYRAMYRRDWEVTQDKIKKIMVAVTCTNWQFTKLRLKLIRGAVWRRGFNFTLQYGTNPKMLIWVVVILFVINLPIYNTTANYEASLESLAVPRNRFELGKHVPLSGEGPREWGGFDTLQVALKNHVPIVPLQVRDEWQPRGDKPTTWSLEQGDCKKTEVNSVFTWCLPWSPEAHFNTMQLSNWICWPLLLTFYVRRLLRQKS